VWQLTIQKDGKDAPAKIVWTQKDSQSFAATMYVADSSGTLKRDWTFLHIRVKQPGLSRPPRLPLPKNC